MLTHILALHQLHTRLHKRTNSCNILTLNANNFYTMSVLSYGIEIGRDNTVIQIREEGFSRGVQDVPVANCVNDIPLLRPSPFPGEQNCTLLSEVIET